MATVSLQLIDSAPSVTVEAPAQAARAAGLRYVSDDRPGFGRRRCGKGFTYLDESGDRISDRAELKRLKALVIPPAWEAVWICPFPTVTCWLLGAMPRGARCTATILTGDKFATRPSLTD
ncbi:MAG: hypothetical protein ACFCVB_12720 [Nodosilinea sp.]